jgi:hypothetical protein
VVFISGIAVDVWLKDPISRLLDPARLLPPDPTLIYNSVENRPDWGLTTEPTDASRRPDPCETKKSPGPAGSLLLVNPEEDSRWCKQEQPRINELWFTIALKDGQGSVSWSTQESGENSPGFTLLFPKDKESAYLVGPGLKRWELPFPPARDGEELEVDARIRYSDDKCSIEYALRLEPPPDFSGIPAIEAKRILEASFSEQRHDPSVDEHPCHSEPRVVFLGASRQDARRFEEGSQPGTEEDPQVKARLKSQLRIERVGINGPPKWRRTWLQMHLPWLRRFTKS